ncbi:hypothetical protein NDU88_005314 [Pleurodeles waltl]|uniref:Uncharacterized protein n=1 Tax=Pleurodeles waltl TaxID=8319 RepID=A0AAV7N0V6_PLEWA|nr:hypothetical protein NDU88_005314 [Pleurodeles waltl]
MERVGATGLQLGVGRGSERGPRSWQQGYTASNPDRRWYRHRAIPRCHAPQWTINGYPRLPRTQRVSSLASGGSRAAITDASVVCSPGGA